MYGDGDDGEMTGIGVTIPLGPLVITLPCMAIIGMVAVSDLDDVIICGNDGIIGQ